MIKSPPINNNCDHDSRRQHISWGAPAASNSSFSRGGGNFSGGGSTFSGGGSSSGSGGAVSGGSSGGSSRGKGN